MMGADEKLVMDTWASPRFDWSYQHGDPSKPKYWLFYVGDWLVISGYDTREQIAASAAEFTRDRIEEIRQVEAEIALVDYDGKGGPDWNDLINGRIGKEFGLSVSVAQQKIRWCRILARLQAALAELKKGMK